MPRISVIYNGDDIGMVDRKFTYAEMVDPASCNAGRNRYHLKSKDSARMPYQWKNSTSAGFSTKAKTWLPVHSDYKTLNLETQRDLHITQYEQSVMVKKRAHGSLNITVCYLKVLCIMRAYGRDGIFVLFGFIDVP
ncbi:hypothetical protein QLX08_001539 [Tetragonisca angustula]|uniref:Glycosyl hydrolase family 13 catalytic domain-containing protein n=2 Tax=Tetragonisca angustula TaxID=166442 RepID=A0AAW1AHF0_9HYME